MNWREITIITTSEASDAVSEMLNSFGAGGVSIEDPYDIKKEIERKGLLDYADESFLSRLGEDVTVKAYFSEDSDIEAIVAGIKEKLGEIGKYLPVGRGFAGVSIVNEEDWANAWKKYYKPFRISDRVVIKPSWEDYVPEGKEIIVELDPGMAFGTGSHETTRMCAVLLDKHIKPGDTVMDAGCGSGILSIIAAKLGAGRVVAFDIDGTAARVARDNVEKNGAGDVVEVSRGTIEDVPDFAFNIIVANIIAEVIISMAPQVPRYLESRGLFITSGIIRERRQDVIDACEKTGFELAEEKAEGEWVALVFRKQGGANG